MGTTGKHFGRTNLFYAVYEITIEENIFLLF